MLKLNLLISRARKNIFTSITIPRLSSHTTLSRWKRRFGNRAEADLSPEEMEAAEPEMLEETAALGKPEHYLLSNKIFPGNKSEEVKDKVQ